MAGYDVKDGNASLASWMFGIDSWYTLTGLPTNFSNHYEMMDYYFDTAVSALADWDKNAHTIKEYRMIMLYGMDNPGDMVGTGAYFQGKVMALNTEYHNLLTKYNISASDLDTYWKSQLKAPISNRLPTSGCND